MTTRFIPAADGTDHSDEHGQPVRAPNGSPMFTEQQLDQFRRALDEQRRFRIEQLRDLDDSVRSEHDSGPLTEVSAALRVAARAALAEVEAAISRMSIGEYGICPHCGGDVALARLEIVPMAALCMDCQRAAEAGELDL